MAEAHDISVRSRGAALFMRELTIEEKDEIKKLMTEALEEFRKAREGVQASYFQLDKPTADLEAIELFNTRAHQLASITEIYFKVFGGSVAQMGERSLRKREVTGSTPVGSTTEGKP